YGVDLRLWPLAVELSHVKIESTDGGGPAFVADRLAARPKFFGLLSGKLVIEQIELDAPHARIVVRDGKLANVDVELPKSDKEKKVFHAPFSVFAVSDAVVDLDVDGMHLVTGDFDLDVTVDDDAERGSSFEVAARVSEAQFHRSRLIYPKGPDR